MLCKYAVRYPVTFNHRHKCLFSFKENPTEQLLYIEGRKEIYLPVYCTLVKRVSTFDKLRKKLANGENLLIIEVDGPHEESMNYYRENYGVSDDFIQKNTMLVTEENIKIMLNDTKHPFGHGYCLAMALLGKDIEWNN